MTTGNRMRIWVVDDEPGIVMLCDRLLSQAGHVVNTFTDPRLALEAMRKGRAELLLVDIRMPEISGFDLIKKVRELHPDMAILAMTGHGTVETAIQALRNGVDGLLLKPFTSNSELIETVQQALQDNQQKQDLARMQALRPLFSITEALLSETRPDILLGLILETMAGHLQCSHVAFYQHFDKNNEVRLLASRGRVPVVRAANPDGNSVERVCALDQPMLASAGRTADLLLSQEMAALGHSSILAARIGLTNMRSVLFAGRDANEPPFREVDMDMFLTLARQATIAMENAQLYGELRAYVRRVEESQQALVQAEKLAAAGRLTASIAHEVNNPLQSVRNCLHLATREDLPLEKRQEYMDLTRQELDRLISTVQRMLDFYRPSAEFKPVQILDLLEHVLSLLGSQLRENKVRVTSTWPAQLPSVRAISNQIEQVFINIILNASDVMTEGGELLISIAQKRKMVEITFQDTGPGVPPELRDAIFEPFVSGKGGTGLGLSVSYDIVTAHGGRLDLLPSRGQGACFRVMLPITDSRE